MADPPVATADSADHAIAAVHAVDMLPGPAHVSGRAALGSPAAAAALETAPPENASAAGTGHDATLAQLAELR